MKVHLLISLVSLVGVTWAQSVPSTSASAASAAQQQPASSALAGVSATQNVFHAGSGVIAPELIAPQIPIEKVHHCEKLDGKPIIAVVVDAKGNPSAPMVTQPADGNLNEAALALVARDQFKPGTHDGLPAAVAIEIEVELKTCSRYAPQGSGVFILASLREKPVQKVTVSPPVSPEIAKALSETPSAVAVAAPGRFGQQSGPLVAPVPLDAPAAHYTDAARKAKITGNCLVRIVVDAYGIPQNPEILKSLDPGLDQEAIKAVMQYRFKPAIRNGQPVPVHITIAITFNLR
jgi:TonB family protein